MRDFYQWICGFVFAYVATWECLIRAQPAVCATQLRFVPPTEICCVIKRNWSAPHSTWYVASHFQLQKLNHGSYSKVNDKEKYLTYALLSNVWRQEIVGTCTNPCGIQYVANALYIKYSSICVPKYKCACIQYWNMFG